MSPATAKAAALNPQALPYVPPGKFAALLPVHLQDSGLPANKRAFNRTEVLAMPAYMP